MTANKTISAISTLLVFTLAAVAFTLSFDALRALAGSNGIAPRLSWLFPLAVDGFILAAALASLRANLHGERAVYPSMLVALFTLASVLLNVAHSNGILAIPRQWLATVVAAVPPIALVLASELLFAQVRSTVELRSATTSLPAIQLEVTQLTEERQALRDDNKALRKTGKTLAVRIDERQAELDAVERGPVEALLDFYRANPMATHDRAATEVGRSRQWVGQRLAKMVKSGEIRRNGREVEVVEVRL